MDPIYNITDENLARLEEDESGLQEAYLQRIDEDIKTSFSRKAPEIALLVLNLNACKASLETEIDRLTNRKKSIQEKTDWLRDRLKNGMEMLNIPKIKGSVFTCYLSPSPPSIEADVDLLEEKFIRVKKEADKRAILEYIEETGITPRGAIKKQGKHLVIR